MRAWHVCMACLPACVHGLHTCKLANLRMRMVGRCSPYLVFGPFGTGKTRTLVEYLKLLLNPSTAGHLTDSGAPLMAASAVRVLVCSPSNSSADTCAAPKHSPSIART